MKQLAKRNSNRSKKVSRAPKSCGNKKPSATCSVNNPSLVSLVSSLIGASLQVFQTVLLWCISYKTAYQNLTSALNTITIPVLIFAYTFVCKCNDLSAIYPTDTINILDGTNKTAMEKSSTKEKQFLLIHTGGTIGMVPNDTNLLTTKKGVFKEELIRRKDFNDSNGDIYHYKGTNSMYYKILELDPIIDSSDITYEHWNRIIKVIEENYDLYNGFIIVHGTDTLAYTANMLSYAIENLAKPIILTGSMYSIFEDPNISDAEKNLKFTFEFASKNQCPGVFLSFNEKIFPAQYVKKLSSNSYDSFGSLGTTSFDQNIVCDSMRVYNQEPAFINLSKPNVYVHYLTPLSQEPPAIESGFKKDDVLVLMAYGTGNIPSSEEINKSIEKIYEAGGIVVVLSQCPDSCVFPAYSSWGSLKKVGAIPGGKSTVENMVSKITYLKSKGISGSLLRLMIYLPINELHHSNAEQLKASINYILGDQNEKFKENVNMQDNEKENRGNIGREFDAISSFGAESPLFEKSNFLEILNRRYKNFAPRQIYQLFIDTIERQGMNFSDIIQSIADPVLRSLLQHVHTIS